ncbi:alpha/beta hydrolase [Lysobacteraceae bacterium NML75-0749]|nr:alpha/beta hydrolase [Xanthomonadaceae bacterium NML75-0749]PJK05013.1 alpha/beta hydrolase [Xanthomonadaceae bacterium NML91-0268]
MTDSQAVYRPDYPFKPQRLEVRPGIWMSYLDEGPRDGEVVLMLHGNPSWSYYWRHLVLALRDKYRCIVPDHIGMGLSDKPDDAKGAQPRYDYTLASRIEDVDALLKHLGINGSLTLAVHDWGGMIGFGWGLQHGEQIKRLVITNTAAFPLPAEKPMPWQIAMGRHSRLGGWLIRRFNLFARGAAAFGTVRILEPAIKQAYSSVYDGWQNAIATLRFMQDIPLDARDRAWPLLQAAAEKLPSYADRPAFIGWGLRDFVFAHHFLAGFQKALPHAEVHAYPDASHYVLEDKREELPGMIRAFLDANPLN